MAGPGTKRTDSPGALQQTRTKPGPEGPSRKLGLRKPQGCSRPLPGSLIRRNQPLKRPVTRQRVSPGVHRSPPKTNPVGGNAQNRGTRPGSPAGPVLGDRGEKVPAILCRPSESARGSGTSSTAHLIMPARIGRAQLAEHFEGGEPPPHGLKSQSAVPGRSTTTFALFAGVSRKRVTPHPSLAAGCTHHTEMEL